ncbi:hypothetical protein BVY04_05180 [bacterium M21]|nr:hypothetical protein BVY04_05180 [bacterium M21]
MAVKQMDIAEFYQQPALLVKANLPLPDSLTELGAAFHKPEFKEVLQKIGMETAKGRLLHEAMVPYEPYFPKFHRQLIQTGEDSQTLPEILHEVASFARVNQLTLGRLKEVVIYPLFTLWLCSALTFGLMIFMVKPFEAIFRQMLAGEPLPLVTLFYLNVSDAAAIFGPVLPFIVLGLTFLFALWLFSGTLGADRLFRKIVYFIPSAAKSARESDMARACSLLSIYLHRKTPLTNALSQTAELAEHTKQVQRSFQASAKRSFQAATGKLQFSVDGQTQPLAMPEDLTVTCSIERPTNSVPRAILCLSWPPKRLNTKKATSIRLVACSQKGAN